MGEDLIFKLRVLRYMLHNAFTDWQGEIWRRDLDGQYCCDGRECCCGGETLREMWRWSLPAPPITTLTEGEG